MTGLTKTAVWRRQNNFDIKLVLKIIMYCLAFFSFIYIVFFSGVIGEISASGNVESRVESYLKIYNAELPTYNIKNVSLVFDGGITGQAVGCFNDRNLGSIDVAMNHQDIHVNIKYYFMSSDMVLASWNTLSDVKETALISAVGGENADYLIDGSSVFKYDKETGGVSESKNNGMILEILKQAQAKLMG